MALPPHHFPQILDRLGILGPKTAATGAARDIRRSTLQTALGIHSNSRWRSFFIVVLGGMVFGLFGIDDCDFRGCVLVVHEFRVCGPAAEAQVAAGFEDADVVGLGAAVGFVGGDGVEQQGCCVAGKGEAESA